MAAPYRPARVWMLAVTALVVSAAAMTLSQSSPITVFPTRVTITPQAPSGSIQLKNESAGETRFQVTLHTWSMSAAGEMELAPTQDLVAFPTVFALQPGETRSVRVGSQKRAGTTELSYRILIEELADTSDTTGTAGIRMLRRLNVPVFVQPGDRQLKAELHDLSIVRPGRIALRVRNLGTTHFIVGEITVQGRAAGGASVVEAKRDGWYVLPGNDVSYEVDFDPAACARLANLSVSIRIRDVPIDPLIETLNLEPGGCGGA